jgi:hypothetical protein
MFLVSGARGKKDENSLNLFPPDASDRVLMNDFAVRLGLA